MDYWFLGRYLQGLKKSLGYAFPLFALTATAVWNPKGGNDRCRNDSFVANGAVCALSMYGETQEYRFRYRRMEIERGETYE